MLQHLTSIVAIDRHGAIGCKNRLPWTIKSDLSFFRRTTLGNTVIMGRKTYDSIGGCLKGRTNLVLSHNSVLFRPSESCRLVNSVSETLAAAFSLNEDNTYIIGGAATYTEFAPLVDRYLVTVVEHVAPDADAFLSDEIMQEYSAWPCEEIASFPAEEGRDEFPFRIISYSAPDGRERSEARKALAHQYLSKRQTGSDGKNPPARKSRDTSEAAFLF